MNALVKRNRKVSKISEIPWKTADGEVLRINEMTTSHLFFAFRMFYAGCAKRYNWKVFRNYAGREINPEWSPRYIANAMFILYSELALRDDLKEKFHKELQEMMEILTEKSVKPQVTLETIENNFLLTGETNVS
jgi:hypothetical protein